MQANIIKANHSSITLPSESNLIRLPRAPKRKRKQKFWKNFDAHTLVYDIFWHQNNKQIILVCPPPLNLESIWRRASFIALPSKQELKADFHILRSTMSIALNEVPRNTKEIKLVFNQKTYIAKVQDNLSDEFKASNLMFTMNKNNPLEWIKEWAQFHQTMHNVNSIILFDNGSTIYDLDNIEKTLSSVKGIKTIAVIPLNYKYGPHDPSVIMYRFWANFLQLSSFSIMFRRFGAKAHGILNCDIDEFVAPIKNSNIFEEAVKSKNGLFILKGLWVEGITKTTNKPPIHTDFAYMLRDFRSKLNANKWALDPSHKWLKNLDIHPAVHKIRNAPKHISKNAPSGIFWHFKGINTNWKEDRNKNKKPLKFLYYQPSKLKEIFMEYLEQKNAN